MWPAFSGSPAPRPALRALRARRGRRAGPPARGGHLRLAAALAALAALAGCRGDTCFLKVCYGDSCRCSISSCGEGAGFDTTQNRCRCLKGFIPIAGRCLSKNEADKYCGRGRHWEDTGCAQDRCRPGDEIDQRTGLCVPVSQVASNIGVSVGSGQQLGCPPGQKLVIDGPTAVCVPLSQTCAPDETWTGQACAKLGRCPTGSVWDPMRAQCVQYAQGTGSDELNVDVASWAFATYGPDGGPGTSAFCGAFARKPLSFGILEGSSAYVRVSVMLSFPDREIVRGALQTVAAFDASGNPVPASGAAEVDAAARSLFAPLLLGGGRASALNAITTVKCPVINAEKPRPVPAVGGL